MDRNGLGVYCPIQTCFCAGATDIQAGGDFVLRVCSLRGQVAIHHSDTTGWLVGAREKTLETQCGT